jgi:hypothetical protein
LPKLRFGGQRRRDSDVPKSIAQLGLKAEPSFALSSSHSEAVQFMDANDIFHAGAKAAPPVAYVGVTLVGISLPDWVAIATLAYIGLQAAHLIWRWLRQARRRGAD